MSYTLISPKSDSETRTWGRLFDSDPENLGDCSGESEAGIGRRAVQGTDPATGPRLGHRCGQLGFSHSGGHLRGCGCLREENASISGNCLPQLLVTSF